MRYLQGLGLLVVVACNGKAPARKLGDRGLDASAETIPAQGKTDAESQFARFLSLSIATREKNRVYVDSVYTGGDISTGRDVAPCLAGDETVNLWLADYQILSVGTHADTGEASAAITTVVREVQEPDGESFIATPRIEEDTAKWRLVRGSGREGKWMVCGPGLDHRELFGLFKVGRTVKWPSGGSAEAVVKTIDSLRRARGLTIIR